MRETEAQRQKDRLEVSDEDRQQILLKEDPTI